MYRLSEAGLGFLAKRGWRTLAARGSRWIAGPGLRQPLSQAGIATSISFDITPDLSCEACEARSNSGPRHEL